MSTQEQAWYNAMQQGQQRFQQGDPGAAVKEFARATELAPARVEGWVNLGSALVESANYDSAVAALQRATALNPKIMACHMILGDAQRQLGHWPEAVASYNKAVSLQRAPVALNRLACALRAENKQLAAESLYLEALQKEPDFTLAKVNLATVQIELDRYDEAETQLRALAAMQLTPPERAETESAQSAVSEYLRLHRAITSLNVEADLAPLERALHSTPQHITRADKGVMERIKRYADSASRLCAPASPETMELPEEWPLIEAMFMIPFVNSVDEYRQIKADIATGLKATGDLLESTNMEAAVQAARLSRQDMSDPVKAELHMRHWHALACRDVPGFLPGHFKYTQNWSPRNPTLRRVDPALASGTVRHFVSDIYRDVSPGIARAAVVWMAVSDIHAFADGNGRVAVTWANRELEWAGLMPALFSRELGLRGKLGNAMKSARSNDGDVSELFSVLTQAQQYAREFCLQLESSYISS